jgi:hypothetical protein
MRIPNRILVAVVIVGLTAGVGGIAMAAVKAVAKPTPRQERTYKPGKAMTALAKLKIDVPIISVSASPLPPLQISAMNVGEPSTGVDDSFNNFRGDKNLVPTAPKPTIPAMPTMTGRPTAPTAPTGPTATTGPTGGAVPAPTTGGAPTPSTSTCAQFASMPNAGLCSMVGDASGQALCQACKSAGF